MRFLKGLTSLIVLTILLVGIPVALIAFAGNPIPSWDELVRAATGPDYGSRFLMGTVLPLLGWIFWALFAVSFLIELPAQLRRAPSPRVPVLRPLQQGAGFLIGAVLVMFVGAAPALATTPTSAPVAAGVSYAATAGVDSTVAVSDAAAEDGHQEQAAPVAAAAAASPTYTVQDGDSLWRISERTLGSGERWSEMAQLNYGVQQADSWSLTTEHWLNAGWVLTLPADAAGTQQAEAAPAAAATETVIVETERTVVSGDTLWAIAEQELGDGNRYPEIFEATKDDVQPGGGQLTDANLIYPGWVVDVPTVITVPAEEVAPPAPAPVAPDAGTDLGADVDDGTDAGAAEDAGASGGAVEDTDTSAEDEATDAAGDAGGALVDPGESLDTQTDAETDAAAESVPAAPAAPPAEQPDVADPQGSSVDVVDENDWIDEIFNVRTLGGISALTAVGILGLLGVRRLKQRRERKPGQRIAMPTGEASDLELALRAVEDPLGVEHVDHALRFLAIWAQETGSSLPPLFALRLSEAEIALYLDAPTDLPEPFAAVTDDKTSWTVDPDQLPPLERIPSAPYPALVSLGHDLGSASLMIDLEHVGALNIIGDDEAVRGALTGLAIELATSPWAEDLRVTLVGVASELPDTLDNGRFRHIENLDVLLHTLRAQATETERALHELGVESIEEARSQGIEAESWTPEIVILGEIPDEATRAELEELVTRVPRVGIAAVTGGELAGEWTLQMTDDRTAELRIPAADATLPITPQIVNSVEYSELLELLRATEQAPAAAADWVDQEEIRLEDLPPAAHFEDEQPTSEISEKSAELVDQAEAPVELVDVAPEDRAEPATEADVDEWKSILHSFLPVNTGTPVVASVDEPASVEEAASDIADVRPVIPLRGAPYVQLLGPVQVVGARGQEPKTAATSKTNQSVVNRATELIAFLALNPRATAVQVHGALWPGRDPHGGTAQRTRNSHTSRARSWLGVSPAGEPYLPRVGTEGYRLNPEVRTDWHVWRDLVGLDVAKAPTSNLVQALRLVKGQPFEGVKERFYAWAEPERYEIIAAIGDAAHELATRALRAGDTSNARLAAAVGRKIDPVNELFWRDAIKAEHQAGDDAGVERIVKQLELHLDSFEDGYEAEPETQELIASVRGRAIAS